MPQIDYSKVLNGEALLYYSGLIKTALAGKADTGDIPTAVSDLTNDSGFQTSSDVASAISGKQDALVFNTAYNASTNKVATMSDLPDISGKQDTLVFNTAYNASTNKVATMSDLPDISGKQDSLVFNTAYNASTNKVATMSDITSAISNVGSFSFEVVASLPSSNISTSTIYLTEKATSGTNQVYTEWAYIDNTWEIIGDTSVSISTLSNADVATIWSESVATSA